MANTIEAKLTIQELRKLRFAVSKRMEFLQNCKDDTDFLSVEYKELRIKLSDLIERYELDNNDHIQM